MKSRNEGPEMQNCSSCQEPSWILALRVSAGGLARADPGAPVDPDALRREEWSKGSTSWTAQPGAVA